MTATLTHEQGLRGQAPLPVSSWVKPLFIVTSFLGSGLLFLVQPMVARFLLPLAGGSAGLWNAAMVFFQLVLLVGYLFAHLSTTRLGLGRQPYLQLVVLVLPLAFLPIAIPDGWQLPAQVEPALWVIFVLAVSVGLPFFALATSSPTLQRWFSVTAHADADDPYFLYAAGNLGSVLALVAYPVVVEPFFSLQAQAQLWAVLYLAFLGGSIACALVVRWSMAAHGETLTTAAVSPAQTKETPVDLPRRARWLLWSFIPALLMLGVTSHITADLASFPLLWVIPLLLYLATFIVAFGRASATRSQRVAKSVWLGSIALVVSFFLPVDLVLLQAVIQYGWMFVAALMLHSMLAEDRPEARHLTEFYVVLSMGGALGGLVASLLAPLTFTSIVEYPLAIGLVLIVAPKRRVQPRPPAHLPRLGLVILGALGLAALQRPGSLVSIGLIAVVIALLTVGERAAIVSLVLTLVAAPALVTPDGQLFRDRSFFGVYIVYEEDGERVLQSGTTNHGTQIVAEGASLQTTGYYHADSPVGQAFAAIDQRTQVGIVGLGSGGLSAYGRPGDSFTFWEIDSLVVDIAEDERLFTYLRDTPADVNVELADGRLGVASADHPFDVLVIDAFSSDAIPVHLMTREAVNTYLSTLNPEGVLLLHISNRHFDLAPVLGRISDELGATAAIQRYVPDDVEEATFAKASTWVAIAAGTDGLAWIDQTGGSWDELPSSGPLWTDDYSNVLSAIIWPG